MISMNVEETITKPNLNDQAFWIRFQDECNRLEAEAGWNTNPDVIAIDKLLSTVAENQIKIFKDHVIMSRKIRISIKNKAASNKVEVYGNNIHVEYEGDFDLYKYSETFDNLKIENVEIRKVRESALGQNEDMAIVISL